MQAPLRCADSTLEPAALLPTLAEFYSLGRLRSCELLARGLHATYVVDSDLGTFALRIYHAHWQTLAEIQYELEALRHLAARGVAVSAPVPRSDGGLATEVLAPEGPRQLAVFDFVHRTQQGPLGVGDASDYGRLAAQLHTATDDLPASEARRGFSEATLLEEPVDEVLRQLDRESEARAVLARIHVRARSLASDLDLAKLPRGFCHGDMNFGNAMRDVRGRIVLTDFECCGPGPRIYDLSVYRWTAMRLENSDAAWLPFVAAYREKRALCEAELAAVPLLTLLRQVWLIGRDALRTSLHHKDVRWRRERTVRDIDFLKALERDL
jgi:Ser/Thr protein kinase RdoA (MazF antagonist)